MNLTEEEKTYIRASLESLLLQNEVLKFDFDKITLESIQNVLARFQPEPAGAIESAGNYLQ